MSMEASGGGASVGSSDRNGGNNGSDECHIPMDRIEESSYQRFSLEEKKLFDSFEKALEGVNKTDRPDDDHANPKIQKVPSMLREKKKFSRYFEPKVFSVGPYYHRDCTLKKAKQIKVNLAAKFLERNSVQKEDLYEDIRKQIKPLKYCYDDELTKNYEDHKLAWMFLVDGCAILQFMYISGEDRQSRESRFRKLGIKFDYAVFLRMDLFLLENQLPYRLLLLIIRHASKQEQLQQEELLKSIYKFIFFYIRSPEEWYWNKVEILEHLKHDHVHLLDILRKMIIQPLDQIHKKHDFIEIILGWTADLFDKLRCNGNENWVPVRPFRNIGKLREAGINLKPSETRCVTDITFIGGTLKLPPIILDESTASTFLNILGYEMCPDFHNHHFEFSSYMYFMDKLIDRTRDVEELREKKILQHELGRDEDVTELFNEIGSHLFQHNEIYYEVKWSINNYLNNKGFRCLRKVNHDIHQYFKNRWSLLALIAALLALASAIIQTVYTVSAYYADSKKDQETRFRKLEIKFDYKFFLVHDLFLLENQLPFQVLQLIIGHVSKEDELLNSIYKFIFYYIKSPEEWNEFYLGRGSQSHVAISASSEKLGSI
ncbi:hypothetical protein Dsin_004456 [Dipteronia sinensis]|uniref:Uncharacterized protein n=1 Tax=Dipteronia sinensis TaxID=43782 RepID=A0AAE0AW03_9ROSI|nr:hypothetical protein Dsin_004456 [Dipteronia sinensis]